MPFAPSLPEALTYFVDDALERVHTSKPARVVSFDPVSGQASVQPLVQRAAYDEDGDRFAERLPVVHGIPVAFPGNGAFSLTWKLQPGDTVLLVTADSSTDQWRVNGDENDPLDDRRFHLADSFAIPFPGASMTIPAPTDESIVLHGAKVRLGSKDADKKLAINDEVKDAIIGCLTDTAVLSGLDAYPAAAAINETAAQAALRVIFEGYFTSHPLVLAGTTKVRGE